MRKMPPLNAVRAFEAAGRAESFTRAAAELGVTQGAISRQVKIMEAWVGTPLFVRANNRLMLTHAGRALLPEMSDTLDRMAHAFRRVARAPNDLRIKVPTTFAMLWLLGRLPEFQARHPELTVHLAIASLSADPAREDWDAEIAYCPLAPTKESGEVIVRDRAIPVCSPAYLEQAQLSRPQDIRHRRLLMSTEGGWEWQHWASAVGIPALALDEALEFDSHDVVIHAAIAGHGIALGSLMFIANELRLGHLVTPLEIEPVVQGCHRLFIRNDEVVASRVQPFHRWLLSAVRADDDKATAIWKGNRPRN